MDRRLFNKTLAALAAAPSVLFKPAASAAASVPVGAALPSFKETVLGHYGLNSMNIETMFELQNVFECPLPLNTLDTIEATPRIETQVSFWIDKDRTIERTVYFEGTQKEWNMVEAAKRGHSKVDEMRYRDEVEELTSEMEGRGSRHRTYYAVNEITFWHPDNNERQFPACLMKKDEYYTIKVKIGDESCAFNTELTMPNFLVVDIQDFSNNEVDIQSQECRS